MEELIQISSDPITKLDRKLDYQFMWLKTNRQIIVKCFISHYDVTGSLVENAAIKTFEKPLIASDSLVDPLNNGRILTPEEVILHKSQMNDIEYYKQNIITYSSSMSNYSSSLSEYYNLSSSYVENVTNYSSSLATYNTEYPNYVLNFNNWMVSYSALPVNERPPVPVSPHLPAMPLVPSIPVEPTAPIFPGYPTIFAIEEYDFYVFVLGNNPIILYDVIEMIVHMRDSEGKFN